MAVEKTAPVITPFQPRLAPRPVRPRGFQAAMDDVLGTAPSEAPIPVPQPVPFPEIPQGGPVSGIIRGMTVAAPIDRRTLAPKTPDGASGPGEPALPALADKTQPSAQAVEPPGSRGADQARQFAIADEAALRDWASRVKAAAHQARHVKTPPVSAMPRADAAANPPPSGGEALSVAETAAAQLGKRYVLGGESPRGGFDCSGLTSYAYAQSGLELPHNSREQFRQGKPVPRDALREGDLVFFGKKGVHHVGIYLADGRFVHAASSGGKVSYGSLDDPVWAGSYAGARRML